MTLKDEIEDETRTRTVPGDFDTLCNKWNSADETVEGAWSTIRRLAEKDFADHTLTKYNTFSWMCGKPGTGVMRFYVLVEPGAIIVYGDVGDWILRVSERTSEGTLDWIRAGVRSPHYLMEKLHAVCSPKKEFYHGDAYRWLYDSLQHTDDSSSLWALYEELKDRRGVDDGHEWGKLVYDITSDAENCSVGDNISSRTMWLVESLKTFIRLHDANAEPTT